MQFNLSPPFSYPVFLSSPSRQSEMSILRSSRAASAFLPGRAAAGAAGSFPDYNLMGKIFCGFLCSFGAMGDFLRAFSRKIFKKQLKVNSQADSKTKTLKIPGFNSDCCLYLDSGSSREQQLESVDHLWACMLPLADGLRQTIF